MVLFGVWLWKPRKWSHHPNYSNPPDASSPSWNLALPTFSFSFPFLLLTLPFSPQSPFYCVCVYTLYIDIYLYTRTQFLEIHNLAFSLPNFGGCPCVLFKKIAFTPFAWIFKVIEWKRTQIKAIVSVILWLGRVSEKYLKFSASFCNFFCSFFGGVFSSTFRIFFFQVFVKCHLNSAQTELKAMNSTARIRWMPPLEV